MQVVDLDADYGAALLASASERSEQSKQSNSGQSEQSNSEGSKDGEEHKSDDADDDGDGNWRGGLLVWLETPLNPTGEARDISAYAARVSLLWLLGLACFSLGATLRGAWQTQG
jgi:hypothetical protein